MPPNQSDVVLRVLDGEDTIGGSKILVGWGGEGVFLDFGINYGHWGRYFEEYVKPRSSNGLGDLWKLGLVPPVENLYRTDVIPPSLAPAGTELPVKEITGVYVSHGHLDHAGLVGLLSRDIPLVCSRTTASILKAVQDSQNANVFSQSVYVSPFVSAQVWNQPVLASDDKQPFQGRDLFLSDGAGSDAFARFWERPPNAYDGGKRTRPLHAGAVHALQPSSGGPRASAFEVDHSVFGSCGFSLDSPQGSIVYSGDLRSHGRKSDATRAFLEGLKARPPWILLMEGTQVRTGRAQEEAHESEDDESDVMRNCLQVVEKYQGKLVVADFGPRNVERLLSFLDIARRTQRRLVILPKDAYLLHGMHAADPTVPLPGDAMLVVDVASAGEPKGWERFILAEHASHVIHMGDVARRLGEVILCFSFFDVKHLLDTEPAGGCYIYSSSEAHNEEQAIDLGRLANWLRHLGMDYVGFQMVPDPARPGHPQPRKVKGFHASGHMPGHEILHWVRDIAPEHLLPVHTEARSVFVESLRGTGTRILQGGLPP